MKLGAFSMSIPPLAPPDKEVAHALTHTFTHSHIHLHICSLSSLLSLSPSVLRVPRTGLCEEDDPVVYALPSLWAYVQRRGRGERWSLSLPPMLGGGLPSVWSDGQW